MSILWSVVRKIADQIVKESWTDLLTPNAWALKLAMVEKLKSIIPLIQQPWGFLVRLRQMHPYTLVCTHSDSDVEISPHVS